MAKGFKDENGKFRPTGNKTIRDIGSDDGDDVEVNINIDNVDELEEFAKEKAESVNHDENESDDIFDEIKVRFNLKSSKPLYRDEDNETGYIGDRYVYDGVVTANGKTKHFEFTDSVANYNAGEEPKPKDLLYSLIMDLSTPDDEDEFASEYGYNKPSQAHKIFRAVMAEKKKVNDLLTEDQIERLSEALQDY